MHALHLKKHLKGKNKIGIMLKIFSLYFNLRETLEKIIKVQAWIGLVCCLTYVYV
jgi:hypothetical protein